MPPDGDMPNNYTLPISDLYQETYDNQWQEQVQQATSRLERFCVIKSGLTGKLQEFSFVGTTELDEKQGRMQDIVLDELDYFKRRMLPVSFSKHLGYDEDDDIFLHGLDAPVTQTINALKYAAARKMDDVLFGLKKQGGLYVPSKGGIFGTAFAGNDGMDKLELLAENVVPVNHTGSTAKECPMTIEKLNRGITLLQENGILDDASNAYGDQVCCAITPRMREALINDERLQKTDFGFASLRKTNGALDPIMGIQFVIAPNLPIDEEGNIICPMWMKNSLYFGSWKQNKVTVEKRTDKEDTIQIGLKTIMGSTRMREEAFLQIKCKPLV